MGKKGGQRALEEGSGRLRSHVPLRPRSGGRGQERWVVAKKRTERARDLRLTDSLAEQKVWERDSRRTDVLEQAGWRVIRFSASEAVQNIDGLWAEIAQVSGIEA